MDKLFQLERVQKISQDMYNLAENGDWEQLPQLEQERTKVLKTVFENQKVSEAETDHVEKVINAVLLINEKIVKLAEQEKMTIGQHLQGMKKRQNAHSAYMQNK